ncbi:MAG: [protein-PII] uridylyltransferase, partial [Tsuneonella sp.]
LERLRNLLLLTAVDIRAVGPGTWNSWKGQLLGELYDQAQERLRLGHVRTGRKERVAARRGAVAELLGARRDLLPLYAERFTDAYWIPEPPDNAPLNLVQYADAHEEAGNLSVHCEVYEARGATLVTVIAADHAGLFYRIAGGISLAGANIIDARIHTTRTGWAVDNFLVQDPQGQPFREPGQLRRLEAAIGDALANRIELVPQLAKRPLPRSRASAFDVAPQVQFDNKASSRFTVIEVNARDRAAQLSRLARALFENRLVVNSAHVTHYGERAADTFYVTDLTGAKITAPARLSAIESALLTAASDETQAELEKV